MKVLIACEESQEVCKAFRAKGHEAYSCDIQEPSGGHPEWHILGDCLKAIEGGAGRDHGRNRARRATREQDTCTREESSIFPGIMRDCAARRFFLPCGQQIAKKL